MNIVPASQNSLSAAINLIKENNLPTEDITELTKMFVLEDGGSVVGTIALEFEGGEGLLRSLSVSQKMRDRGYGKLLVDFLEELASGLGVKTMYLLTTTAEIFFDKRGDQMIERESVPGFIQKTSEFRGVCPSTAVIMRKALLQKPGKN